jgi:site-specific DNA recombinase
MTPKRAVIYLRVSTSEQATKGGQSEGFSIPAQREANKKKAQSLGAIVVKEFVERGVSGTSTNRPALKAMLRYLEEENGSIDYVVVHKIDRLARNRADDVAITAKLDEYGARLVSTSENIDQTPGGLLMHGIMSSIAEFYSKNLANEVVKWMGQKVRSGGTIGKAPTGYLNVRKIVNGVESRTVDIDPERAPLIRWAFEEYAKGETSMAQLAEELNDRGLTTVPTRKYPARPITKRYISQMLPRRYYIGMVNHRGVEYPGNHVPLIPLELFEKVQRVMRARQQGERQRKHLHFIKSTVWCGDCGSRLMLQRPRNHQGLEYEYFVCLGRLNKKTNCHMPAVPLDWLENQIAELYRDIQLPDLVLDGLRDRLRAQLAEDYASREEERKQLLGQQRDIRAKQEKLLAAYYSEALSVTMMAKKQKGLESSLGRIERQLASLHQGQAETEELIEIALDLARNCHATYLAADDLGKRQLNQTFFEKVYVSSGEDRNHHTHAHLNPWTLTFCASTLVQNDGTKYHHETRDNDLVDGDADGAPDMKVARSDDLATGVTASGARICKSTMVRPGRLELPRP